MQHVTVDTGSAVLAIPMPLIRNPEPIRSQKDQPQPAATRCVTCSSSGNMLVGDWVWAAVSFFDGNAPRGTAQRLPVLGVRYACSPKQERRRGE
ncbi:Hypothetical protein AA314_02180 [Archangium gephyra]|uniref:Uncharacterized protein n=1 Tax=Archangium gephyra TaxID=48 RepID=A0AAC8Q3Z8_9BACT|nr:Hypothetical protein AA314_02180 [Archangium gephyra]